jgi:hypothetical protein
MHANENQVHVFNDDTGDNVIPVAIDLPGSSIRTYPS